MRDPGNNRDYYLYTPRYVGEIMIISYIFSRYVGDIKIIRYILSRYIG